MVVEQAVQLDSVFRISDGAQTDTDVVVAVGLEFALLRRQAAGHHSLAKLALTEGRTTILSAPNHVVVVQLGGPYIGRLVEDNMLVQESLDDVMFGSVLVSCRSPSSRHSEVNVRVVPTHGAANGPGKDAW